MTDTALWLAVDFPNLALEARFGPEPGAGATATPRLLLVEQGNRVGQCNTAAAECGVRPGMSTNTAYCLLETAEMAHGDTQLERDQLHRLALMLYRLCADVRLVPPAGLVMEIGSMLALYRGLDACLAALHTQLEQTGYRFRAATGHTPLAAQVLAVNGRTLLSDDPSRIRQALEPLSVEALGLPERDAAKLARMGLTDYRTLHRAPRAELGYRFGPALIEHLAALERPAALGEPFQLPSRFNERLELWHDIRQADALVFPLNRLLQPLEAYLSARQQCVDRLRLTLEHRERPPTRLSVQSVRGARRAEHWQHLVALTLERQALPEPVIALGVRALGFHDDPGRPGDLLGTAHPREDADHLLSLLVTRLGHNRVLTPVCNADPRPRVASGLQPMTDPNRRSGTPRPAHRHPTLLLPEPTPVNPAEYQALTGPERIVMGHWAQPTPFRRDYVCAWHPGSGELHWLARHADGCWYREGVFA